MKRQKYEECLERSERNISYGNNGKNSKTARITLPIKYLEKIGVSEDKKEIVTSLYKNKIVIERK